MQTYWAKGNDQFYDPCYDQIALILMNINATLYVRLFFQKSICLEFYCYYLSFLVLIIQYLSAKYWIYVSEQSTKLPQRSQGLKENTEYKLNNKQVKLYLFVGLRRKKNRVVDISGKNLLQIRQPL